MPATGRREIPHPCSQLFPDRDFQGLPSSGKRGQALFKLRRSRDASFRHLLRKNIMKIKQLVLSSVVAFATLAAFAPTIASAAPHHQAHKAHKVCKWNAHHHHRVCHWVR